MHAQYSKHYALPEQCDQQKKAWALTQTICPYVPITFTEVYISFPLALLLTFNGSTLS